MDQETVIQQIKQFIGGDENIRRCELRKDELYIMVKDAGKVNLNILNKLNGVVSTHMKREILIIKHIDFDKKEKSDMNYNKLCNDILELIPRDNIVNVFHCVTRLRIIPRDKAIIDKEALKNLDGVMEVMDVGEQIQLVVGTDVPNIYNEFCSIAGIAKKEAVEENDETATKAKEKLSFKNFFSKLLDTIAFIMNPAITGMIAGGMLKGIVACITAFHWLPSDSSIITVFNIIGDAPFYFMPIILGYASAKRFGIKEVYGMIIGGILMYPTVMNATAGESLQFLFASIPCVSYASSIFPVMLCTWLFSYGYKAIDKFMPNNLKLVFTGFLALTITMPFLLAYIAPFGTFISGSISSFVQGLFDTSGPLAGLVYAGTKPITVMFGIKGWGAIIMNNIATLGFDYLLPLAFIANLGSAGASLAVYFKSGKTSVKSAALSSGCLCVLGITEPALYGVLVPNKRALIGCLIGSGIGGILGMLFDVKSYIYAMPGIFSLPTYLDDSMNLIWCIVTLIITFIISFVITMMIMPKEKKLIVKEEKSL